MKLGLITCAQIPDLTEEDQRLAQALEERQHEVSAAVWSDKTIDWEQFEGLIVRSIWDYHKRVPEFHDWLERVQNLPVGNSVQTLAWNYRKTYLKELTAKGFNTIPTHWFNASDQPDLAQLLAEKQWSEAIIKPVIGATAYQTHKLQLESIQDFNWDQHQFTAGFMIQKFMAEINTLGEWSHVFFNNQYSHSVLKTAKEGDFRVQGDFGGQKQLLDSAGDFISQCQQILDALPQPPLYARVDGLHIEEQFHIMELELIEPELFIWNEQIAQRFAAAIEQWFA